MYRHVLYYYLNTPCMPYVQYITKHKWYGSAFAPIFTHCGMILAICSLHTWKFVFTIIIYSLLSHLPFLTTNQFSNFPSIHPSLHCSEVTYIVPTKKCSEIQSTFSYICSGYSSMQLHTKIGIYFIGILNMYVIQTVFQNAFTCVINFTLLLLHIL